MRDVHAYARVYAYGAWFWTVSAPYLGRTRRKARPATLGKPVPARR